MELAPGSHPLPHAMSPMHWVLARQGQRPLERELAAQADMRAITPEEVNLHDGVETDRGRHHRNRGSRARATTACPSSARATPGRLRMLKLATPCVEPHHGCTTRDPLSWGCLELPGCFLNPPSCSRVKVRTSRGTSSWQDSNAREITDIRPRAA